MPHQCADCLCMTAYNPHRRCLPDAHNFVCFERGLVSSRRRARQVGVSRSPALPWLTSICPVLSCQALRFFLASIRDPTAPEAPAAHSHLPTTSIRHSWTPVSTTTRSPKTACLATCAATSASTHAVSASGRMQAQPRHKPRFRPVLQLPLLRYHPSSTHQPHQ